MKRFHITYFFICYFQPFWASVYWNLETNPVLSVVARLRAKRSATQSPLQRCAPTIIPLGSARVVEKLSVSILSYMELHARLWLLSPFFSFLYRPTAKCSCLGTFSTNWRNTSEKLGCPAGINLVYKVHQVVNISSSGFGSKHLPSIFRADLKCPLCARAGLFLIQLFF